MDILTSNIYTSENENDAFLHRLFEQQVTITPDIIAAQFGDERLTYAELNNKADALAKAIIDFTPNSLAIGVSTHRCVETIISVMAILKSGKAYIPLDPTYPKYRLDSIITDSGIDTCLAIEAQKQQFSDLPVQILASDKEYETNADLKDGLKTRVAYVIYTSGSTGKPKGVAVGHAGVVNLVNWYKSITADSNPGCRTLQFSPLVFDVSVMEIFGTLCAGGTLVLIDDDKRIDPLKLLGYIAKQQINRLNLPFVALQYLTDTADAEQYDLPSLKEVITAGEQLKVTPKIIRFFKSVPGCTFFNMYGPTETTVISTCLKLNSQPANWSALPSIGKAVENTEIFILDEQLNYIPEGEVGELCISGINLAEGYLNRPELSAEKFIEAWESKPGIVTRIYRSGDLCRFLPDGNIEYLGRKDTQVKIRGNRVEIGEIEVLLNQFNGIQQSVVIAREDNPGDKRLVAYLVSANGKINTTQVKDSIEEKLPDYMWPSAYVWLTVLPKTTSGKVDRNALPKPDLKRPELATLYKPASTKTQKHITALWKELLQLEQVGIDDNFFELGGNSLLGLKTVTGLKKLHNYVLPITKLYQYPTIAGIAAVLDGSINAANETILPKLRVKAGNGDVAVIGMAGRFPGSNTIDELWQVLVEGRETIKFFTDNELDPFIPYAVRMAPNYVKARGVIDKADEFDPMFFGLSPKVAELMDPQQRIFLEIAWEALESTGHLPSKYHGLVGVFAGTGNNTYYINNVIPNHEMVNKLGSFLVTTINEKDYIASRTAYELNLKGPAVSVHSACSTSLLAIAEAVESIRSGQCNVALAGGASITSPINSGHLYQQGTMLSADGHCRSFDAEADGTIFSDGAGVVLLKSLEEAIADGDTIYSVIKGVGLNNDGGGKGSFTAPNATGQAGAIAMAIQNAGISPADISYVEAHGTATVLGDPIEIEGLTMAFGPQDKNQYCALGSIKSNMGHLTAAAGVAGLIKATLALYHKKIPASLHYKSANPNIDFENSPFYVNTTLTDWEADKRIAGVSSFGVGGTNVHVILEEYPQELPTPAKGRDLQLISWSAKTETSAENYRQNLASYIKNNKAASLADIAYTLQTTRTDFNNRYFVIANSKDDLAAQLAAPLERSAFKTLKVKATEIAFMFPGQGAQYVNMGRELYENEPVFAASVNECVNLLKGTDQEDILQVVFSDSADAAEKLKNTLYTQPALFIISYAMAKLWISWGIEPAVFTGHSIGEFVAGHFAGIFSLADAVKLIAVRAKMVSETQTGSMVSVRMSEAELKEILPATLSIAVVNSNLATVAAGPDDEVKKFVALLEQKGIAARVLQTSHAFHSAMMDPIVGPFEEVVKTIRLNPPVKPIISTITGNWMSEAEATDPKYWANHLRNTVRFADLASLLAADETRIALEVGPGKVLATLVKQQAAGKPAIAISGIEQTKDTSAYRSVLKALGQLWLNGIEPDWKAFYNGQNRLRVNIPTYAYDRKRLWVDPVIPISTLTPPFEAPSEVLIDNSQETLKIMPVRKDLLIDKLKVVFEDASGIDIDSTDTSFVEIGFDSLLLTQIATNLKKEFGVPITFRKLFEDYNSLDLLSVYLDDTLPADKYQPTAAAQQPAYQPQQPIYNQASYQQPVYQPNPAPVYADGGNQALNMIAQQLSLLASQVANMQNRAMQQVKVAHVILPPPPMNQGIVTSEKLTAPVAPAELQPDLTPEEQIENKKPFGATAKIERHIQGLNEKQQAFLDKLIIDYNTKTKTSKAQTQKHRAYMADPRVVSGFRPLTKEIVYPVVVKRSKGCRLWDVDDNEYIDALNGFGSNMLGYQPDVVKAAIADQLEKGYEIGPQHELAGEVCKLLCDFTGFDRAALCSTGSEGVLGAMRIARTVTGRSIIVAFSGSYHGIMDEVIVRGTKKLRTVPAAPGIMPEAVQNMLILDYGTDETLRIIEERKNDIAAVLVEVVQSRRPEFLPLEFLKKLRAITEESKTALIFDEVITGFRMHPGGIQAITGIRADIGTYGKVIGGGLPIGVIAGKKEYMDALDGGFWEFGDDSKPEAGVTYFAGTFVRHPLALAATRASLLYMKERGPALQQSLTDKATRLADAVNAILQKHQTPMYIARFGSLWKLKYHEEFPYSELLFNNLRLKGIHIMDGFPCFMTDAHGDAEINTIIEKFEESVSEFVAAGFVPNYIAAVKPAAQAIPAVTDMSEPPVPDARLGRDNDGNPGWFISDDKNPVNIYRLHLKTIKLLETTTFNYEVSPVEFDPFAGPEITLIAPATESQLEIWTSCLIGGADASCAYNDSSSIMLNGIFNQDAMLQALQALSDRHEALRTVFSGDGKTILVCKNPVVEVAYHDLSAQDDGQHKLFIKNYARQNAITPLDLVNGPLYKASLFKLSNDEHYVTLLAHHIICDGWSVGIMLQDLSKLYTAFATGQVPNLPPAPRFSEYAIKATKLSEETDYKETEAYWINHFKGSNHLLNVPVDNPRPALRTYKSQRLDFNLDVELVTELKTMGRKAGSSYVTTLLTAFEVFLQQLTGQDEIIIGLPAAGQSVTGNYGLVGHCMNLLALRSHPKGDKSFIDYLKVRKSEVLDVYDHQQYTFGTLLKHLNIPRNASRLPLVPVVFNIDIGMDEGVNFHNLKHRYINNPREYETFEIFLNITDNKGPLTVEWSYNTQLFEAATITRMMEEFEHLLRQLIISPDTLIGNIPVLRSEELLNQLNKWNNTTVDYPKEKPLHQIISETAAQYPANIALKFGSETYTYKQLNEKANQLAALLIGNGIKPGDKVAISLDRSAELVIGLLAIIKSGATYVPLDPAFPLNRINYMLSDSAAVVLLTSNTYKGHYQSNAKEILLDEAWATLDNYPVTDPYVAVKGDDLIYILYTSGSTGQPKGVKIAHHNVVNFLYSMQKTPGLTVNDKLLAVTTISFDIAGLELYLPLITGAQIILADTASAKDGNVLLEIIKNEKITVMQATPYTWRIMLEAGWDKEAIKVICGGEALPMDLATRILGRASSLWNVYGPTETTIWSTVKEITANDKFISIGKPIDNTGVYILDKFLNPLAPGTAGELYINGEGVAKGYLNQQELTDEKFVADPFSDISDAKMYRTGDLAIFTTDGDMTYISRIDAQVKIRGYRIETGEIEYNLSQENNIKQAVVIARPDHNGVNKLVAYVVLSDGVTAESSPELINHWRSALKNSLPDYMIPDNFIIIPEMPLTPNGKVDKKELAADGPIPTEIANQYLAPRTDVEKMVTEIWMEYLKIDKIGIYDNFFELGGHSLIAVQVMARIEKETGKRLPLAILFENSTVEKLSLVLQLDGKSIIWDSLVPIKPTGNKMPIYIVHGAGLNVLLFNTLAKHMDADQPVYGMQAKGLNGIEEPLSRIEDIAAHYIASIRVQNLNGPYALAGFSFGGIIAWEMARQLEALNLEVKMLAMFDTYAYRSPHYDPWLIKNTKRGLYFARKMWYSFTFQDGFQKTITNRTRALKRGLVRTMWKLAPGNRGTQIGFSGYSNKIDMMNDIASKHYRLQPHNFTIELFRAEVHSFYVDDFEYMGWTTYALNGINVHRIPGEHNTIFKEPNDKIFADILQDCLNKSVLK